MKRITILLIPLFLFCQSAKPAQQPTVSSIRISSPKKSMRINHFLDELPVKLLSYNNGTLLSTEQINITSKSHTVLFNSSLLHMLQLSLPTSPQLVYLEIKQAQGRKNMARYGDAIAIQNGPKSIVIFNKTTESVLCTLPKKDSSFHVGTKQLGIAPKKIINLYNLSASSITARKTAYRGPDDTEKDSKVIEAFVGVLPPDFYVPILTYSAENFKNIAYSTLVLTIEGALQKIKIHTSCDKIQNNDNLYIQYEQGHIVLTNARNQELARICTLFTKLMVG